VFAPPHRLVFLVALFCASGALAQVEEGDFRLYIDTDVFNVERTLFEKAGERQVSTRYDFGPGGSALTASVPGFVGLGVGYAIKQRIIPSLHFSFARHVGVNQPIVDGTVQASQHDPTVSTFMLRPELEVPFNPKSKGVLGIMGGFDFRTFKQKQEVGEGAGQFSRTVTALGPLVGVIAHFFVADEGSVDVAAVAILNFIDAEGDGPFTDAVNYYSIGGSVMVGLSLWP
jgi:hypothetical protein